MTRKRERERERNGRWMAETADQWPPVKATDDGKVNHRAAVVRIQPTGLPSFFFVVFIAEKKCWCFLSFLFLFFFFHSDPRSSFPFRDGHQFLREMLRKTL